MCCPLRADCVVYTNHFDVRQLYLEVISVIKLSTLLLFRLTRGVVRQQSQLKSSGNVMAADSSDETSHYGLYYNPYSICSLQVLYTLKLRGEARDRHSEMIVHLHKVDILHEEQLDEHFLCEINDHGQVRTPRGLSVGKEKISNADHRCLCCSTRLFWGLRCPTVCG